MKAEIVRKFADLFSSKTGAVQPDSPVSIREENGMLDNTVELTVDQHRVAPDGGFAKRLRWKIEGADTQSETLMIAPAMAEVMLQWNDRNRPLSKMRIRNYANQMKDGHWAYTRVPIIFSRQRLIDGQHRLVACVTTGVAFRADISYGAPDDAFYYIDVGGTRTASDIFSINGVPNFTMAAAATRLLMAYEANRTSGAGGVSTNATLEETYHAYCGYEGLQDIINVGQRFASDRLPSPSAAAAIHYLCARKSRKVADEYFEKLASGLGFSSRRDPAYKVRDFLTRADSRRVFRRDVICALIQGWNAIRTNKPLADISVDTVGTII